MSYALVNIDPMPISLWVLDINENWEYQTYTAVPGTIMDLIIYDGVSAYEPPPGLRLEIVPDTAKIGDTGY
jgi:hypothetical protein